MDDLTQQLRDLSHGLNPAANARRKEICEQAADALEYRDRAMESWRELIEERDALQARIERLESRGIEDMKDEISRLRAALEAAPTPNKGYIVDPQIYNKWLKQRAEALNGRG